MKKTAQYVPVDVEELRYLGDFADWLDMMAEPRRAAGQDTVVVPLKVVDNLIKVLRLAGLPGKEVEEQLVEA